MIVHEYNHANVDFHALTLHFVSVIVQHQCGFRSCHEAGVEADDIEFDAAVFQRLADADKIHRAAVAELFVISVAGDRAAAVIPEIKDVAVCRECFCTILNELRKSCRISHCLVAHISNKRLKPAILDAVNLVDAVADTACAPLLASAGIDDDIDVITVSCGSHLTEVRGCHAALGFKVCTAEIDHHRDGILIVAENLGVFLTRAGSNCIVIVFRSRCDILLRLLLFGMIGELSAAVVGHAAEHAADISGTAAAFQKNQSDEHEQQCSAAACCRCTFTGTGAVSSGFTGISVL